MIMVDDTMVQIIFYIVFGLIITLIVFLSIYDYKCRKYVLRTSDRVSKIKKLNSKFSFYVSYLVDRTCQVERASRKSAVSCDVDAEFKRYIVRNKDQLMSDIAVYKEEKSKYGFYSDYFNRIINSFENLSFSKISTKKYTKIENSLFYKYSYKPKFYGISITVWVHYLSPMGRSEYNFKKVYSETDILECLEMVLGHKLEFKEFVGNSFLEEVDSDSDVNQTNQEAKNNVPLNTAKNHPSDILNQSIDLTITPIIANSVKKDLDSSVIYDEKMVTEKQADTFSKSDFYGDIISVVSGAEKSAVSLFNKPYLFIKDAEEYLKNNNFLKDEGQLYEILRYYKYKIYKSEGYAIKNSYSSLWKAILKGYIEKDNIEKFEYSNKYNLKAYDRAVACLKNNGYLFNKHFNQYDTIIFLRNNGICDGPILPFPKDIIKFIDQNRLFSVAQIRNLFSNEKFINYADDSCIITQLEIRRTVRIVDLKNDDGNKELYVVGEKSLQYNLLTGYFLKDRNSIDIYDIKNMLSDIFGTSISLDDIVFFITKSHYYYSDALEKIYSDKQYYIEEVYKK